MAKKVVVITGGAGGIGQACAHAFDANHQVVLVDVNQQALTDLCNQYPQFDGYVINLTDSNSIHEGVKEIVNKYGRIDILVQTAGLMRNKSALELTDKEFEQMMSINVTGTFLMAQEVVKQSMKAFGGSILNFASEAAIRGFKGPMAAVHYSASKAAIIGMSRQLAVEWGEYQIQVNSICPGGVLTPAMKKLSFEQDCSSIPMGRLTLPEEIAKTILFITSEDAKMITGQNIVIDGGCAATGV